MDTEKLRLRIAALRWAEECFEAADDKEAFAGRVSELLLAQEPQLPTTMKETAAGIFEKWPMPWGQHKGKLIGDVPIEYLQWLVSTKVAESMAEFSTRVKRYLGSARAKRRVVDDESYVDEDVETSNTGSGYPNVNEWPDEDREDNHDFSQIE